MARSKSFRKYEVTRIINTWTRLYMDRFKDIFLNSRRFVSEGISDNRNRNIMNKLFNKGSVALWRIKHTDEIGAADYAVSLYDMDDSASRIYLINEKGLPNTIVPSKEMIVDDDCVIIYLNKSRKPLALILQPYIDRLAIIECLISNNLIMQNIPFLLAVNNENSDAVKDVLSRIINLDIAIATEVDATGSINAMNLNVPYLVDKLHAYKNEIFNEVLTIMGINNNPYEKKERLITDEVNSNNEFIQVNDDLITDELKAGAERATEVLDIDIQVVSKTDVIEDEYDEEVQDDETI